MKKPIPFGKYYLLDRVNVGGMAEVFRAKAFGVEGFERVVAVKRILPSIAEDTEFITMFIDEAKIAVQLTHANIAQIFDLGKVGENYFIALEYVHGKDLRALFDRARKRGEALPVSLACYTIMKVCEGLDYAHNKRDANGRPLALVHRDVSPQNLLVSFDGEVKIIDFGIAKAAGKAGKTQAGILKGKFGYLSPEQVRGEVIDRRSDVFGVGICLYELLTGERLFAGDSDFSSLEKVRKVEVPSPTSVNADIPESLEQIVLKSLTGDPDTRYQTAMDLHDALQSFLHTSDSPFARKELSAWMRATFSEEATAQLPVAASDEASPSGGLDVETFQPMEPADMELQAVNEDNDRDRSAANMSQTDAGRKKPKSTILGMPAIVPSGAGQGGRSVPPPPPPTRSVPPPPPGGSAKVASVPPPRPPTGTPAPPVAARSVPPPPSGTVPERPQPAEAPALSGDAKASARSPVLDMDWDDEDLSTQIYDRPEGSLDFDLPGEGSQPHSARHIPTYVPPVSGAPLPGVGTPSPMQSGQTGQTGPVAGYVPEPQPMNAAPRLAETIDAPMPEPEVGRADTYDGPDAQANNNNTLLLAAVAVLALAVVGFGIFTITRGGDPGIVQLVTHPADATVRLDSQPAGGPASPFVITNVEPDVQHLLEVAKPGYKTWSQPVQVQPGQFLQFPVVTLEPDTTAGAVAAPAAGPSQGNFDPKKTGFSVESSPPGATVILNGSQLQGVTPMRVTGLAPGSYKLQLKLAGHKNSSETQLEVRPDDVKQLPKVVLGGEPVSVTFESTPPGAKVRLVRGDESRSLGNTPLSATVDPTGGQWQVEMSKDGFATNTAALEIKPGAPQARATASLTKVSAQPKATKRAPRRAPRPASASKTPAPRAAAAPAGKGTLRVNSRPWSQVYVDGRLIGNTPQMNISLPSGRHKLMLVNPDFNLRKTLSVTIRANATETKIVNLN